jgi:hypothetical protein
MTTIKYAGKIKTLSAVGCLQLGKVKRLAENGESVKVRAKDCTREGTYYLYGPMERIEFKQKKEEAKAMDPINTVAVELAHREALAEEAEREAADVREQDDMDE